MFTEISEAIKNSKNILIIPHVSADGDCLGSAYALKLMLEELGKKADVILDKADFDNRILKILDGVRNKNDAEKQTAQNEPGREVVAMDFPLSKLPGIGKARIQAFEAAGIHSVRGLLACLPKPFVPIALVVFCLLVVFAHRQNMPLAIAPSPQNLTSNALEKT